MSQGSSDRERLAAHAEVLALQETLGISYKDAAHRLYMAELERFKADEKTLNAVVCLDMATRSKLEKGLKSVRELQKKSSDEMETK